MKNFKKNNKLVKSILSWVAIVTIIISVVSMGMFNVQADVAENPNLKVEVSATPNPAYQGEDITVTTTITPEPFTRNTAKQQIVLVLDVSGSMDYTVTGTRTKRIDALKTAAKNFIETVSKNIENLEICIVEYSTNAVINPEKISGQLYIKPLVGTQTHYINNYVSAGEKFFNAKTDKTKLISMVNCLQAKGGTNIGEGLRKANYMLSQKGDQNAEKSIVFMTDGEPTHYSLYQESRKNYYYTNIDNTVPGYSSTDNDAGLEYSKLMAEVVKKNGYKAYSVGFAIDSNKLKQIHDSMGGEPDNYLITDTDINEAFNTIADTISSTMNVTDVQITLNMQGFTVQGDEGNIIKLDNIVYTYNKQKKQYEAPQMKFSFVIKGEKVGTYDPLKDSYLSYTVEGETQKVGLGGLSLKVNERTTPNINAELVTDNISSIPGQEIEVQYKITTDEFGYYTQDNNITSLSVKDATLNFDLGGDFVAVENGGLVNNNGIYSLSIPEIKYVKTGATNSDGQAIWRQSNADSFIVSFKVKVAPGKSGEAKFADNENNAIKYTNFANDVVSKLIKTPIVLSDNVKIKHGVYSSEEDNGKINPIIETENLTFAKGSVATFAASVENYVKGSNTITLQLSNLVSVCDSANGDKNINVYKVNENGQLTEVGILRPLEGNPSIYTSQYLILPDNEAVNLMVIYSVKLPSELPSNTNTLTNQLSVGTKSESATINCTEELPDLF